MNAWGIDLIFFSALFYFFAFLFNGKSLKWYYIVHTTITMFIVSLLLWANLKQSFSVSLNLDILGVYITIIMSIIFVLVLTQQNRKSYSELLKKEIWGEWAKYQDK